MDLGDTDGGPDVAGWARRLWEGLDDPGEWFVLADWLAERRDPRAVLLRHALTGGRLESAGDHWARLRDVHEKRGFDDVGGLPWELSFLVAGRELLRVPAVSSFSALLGLLRGLSDAQWSAVRPRIEAALERWPDALRDPGNLGLESHAADGVPPPRWWGLVRTTTLSFRFAQPADLDPTSPWFEPLTEVEVHDLSSSVELEFLGQLGATSLRLVGYDEPWPPGLLAVRKVSVVASNDVQGFLDTFVPSCPRLEEVTIVGSPTTSTPRVDLSFLASSALAHRLRALRLVHEGPRGGRMPSWRALTRLERLTLAACRLGQSRSLADALLDDRQLPALKQLDLRWLDPGGSSRIGSIAEWPRVDRLEALGVPMGQTASGFVARMRPLPALRRLSLSGGAPLDVIDRWLASPGTEAPNLQRLDLHVDATPRATAAWAGALDRWPSVTALSLPVRMVERREDVARWARSEVFRGLSHLTLHGEGGSLSAFVDGLGAAGVRPRIVCDLGMRSQIPALLRRAGFVVDTVVDLPTDSEERDWSAPNLR